MRIDIYVVFLCSVVDRCNKCLLSHFSLCPFPPGSSCCQWLVMWFMVVISIILLLIRCHCRHILHCFSLFVCCKSCCKVLPVIQLGLHLLGSGPEAQCGAVWSYCRLWAWSSGIVGWRFSPCNTNSLGKGRQKFMDFCLWIACFCAFLTQHKFTAESVAKVERILKIDRHLAKSRTGVWRNIFGVTMVVWLFFLFAILCSWVSFFYSYGALTTSLESLFWTRQIPLQALLWWVGWRLWWWSLSTHLAASLLAFCDFFSMFVTIFVLHWYCSSVPGEIIIHCFLSAICVNSECVKVA